MAGVFRGKNTAHRVATVEGERERMIAVFSYYEKPSVMFSAKGASASTTARLEETSAVSKNPKSTSC
ncbi:hypothetical protein [Mesorhizobium sp.]|uniref:hypothetical protein n=1 Tax=Mesorhizobium sp. TaxID=1871066 RepID=UPI0025C36841|nr:hypothetical protein [Mesorhizobium sp.]